MALTRVFKKTVQARVVKDAAFRQALLGEAIDCFLAGDVMTGKVLLRDFVNASVGFSKLSRAMDRSPKSLMRMLSPSGNPQANSLFEIVAFLQRRERLRFTVRPARRAA
ncbi:MAG TPA: hypothetical protein VM009_07490 [Terriglobales bacterium]|nr:hypothetical protein [Terriglobales bacterium]